MGNKVSADLTVSTGTPQSCCLSPKLYALYTHDCVSTQDNNIIIKYADDTTTLGLIKADAIFPTAPDRVSALAGSCAVIPCSFSPVHGKVKHVEVRLRFKSLPFASIKGTAFGTQEGVSTHSKFRKRTALAGNLSKGDCSVSIRSLRKDDADRYELQLKEKGASEWGSVKMIHLSVTDSPEKPVISDPGSVSEGQMIVLNCSVKYSCPSEAPTLQWTLERGGSQNRSMFWETKAPGQPPTLHSSLTFIVSHHTKPRVVCEAVYPGNRRAVSAKELHIKFPPKDVSIHTHTLSVSEGGNVLLACTCKADPPVSEYTWSYTQSGHTVILPQRTHMVRIFNVTRDMRVLCAVQNKIGRAESPPTPVNVQYKPHISSLFSSCNWDGSLLACSCAVDANPRPAITWSVNGSLPPDGYNSSVSTENHSGGLLVAVLEGPMDAPLVVTCYAFNAFGNDSYNLLQGDEGTLLMWKVTAVGSTVLSLLLLSLLLLCCCCYCRRKKTERQHIMRYRPPAVYPENMGIYQDNTPLYINCAEVTNIYTNGSYQLVYQNCTPVFVRTKQTHKRQRRAGRRE
ncbi:sialoadhesin, partial [Chanos chanos]|uniref:Sialoadhesin n=1 Tax=Chanos chanos TaxID=29144 RepID=A0A6J2W6P9_CHACN